MFRSFLFSHIQHADAVLQDNSGVKTASGLDPITSGVTCLWTRLLCGLAIINPFPALCAHIRNQLSSRPSDSNADSNATVGYASAPAKGNRGDRDMECSTAVAKCDVNGKTAHPNLAAVGKGKDKVRNSEIPNRQGKDKNRGWQTERPLKVTSNPDRHLIRFTRMARPAGTCFGVDCYDQTDNPARPDYLLCNLAIRTYQSAAIYGQIATPCGKPLPE